MYEFGCTLRGFGQYSAMFVRTVLMAALCCTATVVRATPRDALVSAVFGTASRADTLAQIDAVKASAESILAKSPGNREAALIRAMATGYRAKLTRNRSGALASRAMFDALVKNDPRDADALAALGGWHLDAVAGVGGFLARTMLGADRATGNALFDRAIAAGGSHTMVLAFAALLRLQLSGGDVRGRALAEAASRAVAVTPLDLQLKRGIMTVLVPLRAGDATDAQRVAREVLPLGRVRG